MFDSLENTKFLFDLNVQKELTKSIIKAASLNPNKFFTNLSHELKENLAPLENVIFQSSIKLVIHE